MASCGPKPLEVKSRVMSDVAKQAAMQLEDNGNGRSPHKKGRDASGKAPA